MSTANPAIRRILVLNSDRLLADAIGRTAGAIWPQANLRDMHRLSAAMRALAEMPVDLLITGLVFDEGDVCELVRRSARMPRRAERIAVMTRRRDPRMLTLLRTLPVDGAFDTATESLEDLGRALQEIAAGQRYYSQSFLALLWDRNASRAAELRELSPTEQLVLAVIGDGCDDREAAERLELTTGNIHSIRRSLHAKLGVKDRSALMQRAVQFGLVGLSGRGVERLGFSLLLEHYEASGRRKRAHTEFLDTFRPSPHQGGTP